MTRPPQYKWQPTTAEIAERFGLLESAVIRFDHNTSPYATDWAAGIVTPLARALNEYPGASYAPLRQAAAIYLDIEPTNIVPGAGIDELILLIAKAFLGPNTRGSSVVPTYPMYEIATMQHHGEFLALPYSDDLAFPEEAFGQAAETSDVTWLCIPNNPTGDRIENTSISRIINAAKGIVVIDAAYAEFSGDRWGAWIERHDNLVVLHTMSKAFGLAGLRVGFAIGSPELIGQIDAVRPPGSISSVSAELAAVALAEPQRMERVVRRISRERDRFSEALSYIGLTAYSSLTNFILCYVGPDAGRLGGVLLSEGLVVRTYPPKHPLGNHLRFTVRSPDESDLLVEALDRHIQTFSNRSGKGADHVTGSPPPNGG